MRIFITGVAGYIGSVVAQHLLNEGYEVVGLDSLIHGRGTSILHLASYEKFSFIKGDIEDIDLYKKQLDESDIIIHLAAIVGEPASRKYPQETKRINLVATQKLINYIVNNKSNIHKFIFVSTCSNYGKVAENDYATEEHPLNPLSLYAETKVEVERYLTSEVRDTINWTILRLATVYGLSPRMRFDLTVNHFTRDAVLKKYLNVYLPYSNRPYVHVKDVARAMSLVIREQGKSKNEIFNVGDTKENYRKIDIVSVIKEIIPDVEVEFTEKGNDPRDYKVSFEKIKNVLGFNITRTVKDGVKEVYKAVSEQWLDPFDRFYRNV